MRKTQGLVMEQQSGRLGISRDGSESFSSSSSFSDSYSDSSDLANWEEYVAEDGTLFYAEYMPNLKSKQSQNGQDRQIDFNRSNLRMGKKLARRQQNQQQQKSAHPNNKSNSLIPSTTNSLSSSSQNNTMLKGKNSNEEMRFANINTSVGSESLKELELVVTATDRFRFGRRSTAVESILGFRVVPFVDQPECLMFDGFVHEMPTLQQQTPNPIKKGDWFKSLDDIEIRTSNVDELLLQFVEPTKVCLKFQGTVEEKPIESPPAVDLHQVMKIENFYKFVEFFQQLVTTDTATDTLPEHFSFGLLILPPECYQHDQHKDSLYFYPETPTTNFLYKARGSFLTLNAVLSEELKTKPTVSKLLVDEVQYFVCYRSLNGFLVLFAFEAENITLPEANLRSNELISYMRFAFPSLSLESFSKTNQASSGLRKFLYHFCEIQRIRLLAVRKQQPCLFEEMLQESRSLPLPKEAQLRIFDALSEMEAMDYRNWNDEPLNTHREFFMYGSVLYYDHYVLTSQMPLEIRANVESFLRCRGIFEFISTQYVKELYIWEEIFLPNATGRYFLTICSKGRLLLAVILKIFDAPDLAPNATIPPSLFYIEEIQETLDHLIQCGIESLAMFWSVSNKRPEVLDKLENVDEMNSSKEPNKLDLFLKQKHANPSSSGSASVTASQRSISYDEETHLCSSLGGSSIHSLTPSEDDSSRKRLTNLNLNINIINNNNSHNNHNPDDSDSGSDWDNFAEQHPLHYRQNLESQSHMTESLWKEISNVVPVKISAGWKNSVFYYIYVDNANGSVFCPLKANSESFPFLKEMRKTCHVIHDVLQNTRNYRRLLALESAKAFLSNSNNASNHNCASVSSKGMLAIKEYGITIQVRDSSSDARDEATNNIKGRFVVVGRLFHSPSKEVYICHRPDVPQNMVEMAFRLSFFSVG